VEWLRLENAPAWIRFMLSPTGLIALTVVSALTFIVSLVGASWAVRRLPADYLLHEPSKALAGGRVSPGLVLRNGLGGVLLVLGVLMLVLPGQGLLTILAALGLMDFRGKRRFEHWLMLRPTVLAAINRLRRRSGRPPLLSPLGNRSETG
jgi:putative transmembrane protein PGPGW